MDNPTPTTQDMILDELQQLRIAVVSGFQAHGERLATLESEIHGLTGNGQPGRITKVEERLARVEKFNWKLLGAGSALLTLLEVLHYGLPLLHK